MIHPSSIRVVQGGAVQRKPLKRGLPVHIKPDLPIFSELDVPVQGQRKPALCAPVRLRVGVDCHRYERTRHALTCQKHVDVPLPAGMPRPGVLNCLRQVVMLAIRA